ncbi:MAG: NUDIX hydrolase [Ardenticatenaceae bacterium]|nr:NUDIX hydrolase [Ardenticatenaceae bacterium]
MTKPFRTISSRIAWSCPWYNIRQDEIITPDGQPGIYNVVQTPGAVWIIPVTPTKEIALIYSYRYTVDTWCYEIPAGGIKPGQSPKEAAQAELLEEVGGAAKTIEYFARFYTMNGIGDEEAHIFLATGVTLGKVQHEPTEVIQIHLKPIDEVLRMAQANEISDGPSALAILLCAERLKALR